MAQIVTITNPLTGQPAQVDQLDHTAQQIDDAIARALPGGAIDITLQNKAPAGYGYGDTQSIVFWDDEDGTKLEQALDGRFVPASMREKVFRSNLVDSPICKISGNGGFADILANNSNDSNGYPNNILIVYYAFCSDYIGTSIAVKQKLNGVWSPWEYVNPPMKLGVEYRTTERYLGKPVYAKTVDFGVIPNTTTKWVSFSDDTNVRAIRANAVFNEYNVIPGMTDNASEYMMEVGTLGQTVGIKTYRNWGNYTVKATVHYWKTTD